MIIIIYWIFFSVYLSLSAVIVYTAYRFTQRRYHRGWLGGWLACIVMYNLVFWDWIPVVLSHNYYCNKDAGYWVYQSPEVWAVENPTRTSQVWYESGDRKSDNLDLEQIHLYRNSRYWMSEEIYHEDEYHQVYSHGISRTERRMIDAITGKLLSKSVDYNRGGIMFNGPSGYVDFKIWHQIGNERCSAPGTTPYGGRFTDDFILFKKINGS